MTDTTPTYCTIDVETTANCPIGNNVANPFHPSNYVVLRGHKRGDVGTSHCTTTSEFKKYGPFGKGMAKATHKPITMLVGHNIGFDIHHMRVNKDIDEEFLGTVSLWDTQLAEYILSGQRTTYAKLDDLSAKYGGTIKDTEVKEAFAAGKGADTIYPAKLKSYLEQDLLNTERVFIEQFKRAQKQEQIPLLKTQMNALAATIEMTYNGLKVDYAALIEGCNKTQDALVHLNKQLEVYGKGHDVNWDSPKSVSRFFFGGLVKEIRKVPDGRFKNGNVRFRNQVVHTAVKGLGCKPISDMGKAGYYSVDDSVLQYIKGAYPGLPHDAADTLMKHRELSKQLSTYWKGLLELVMPDGFIHQQLNHCVTRTGRLSSSAPNMQNITNGDIKKVFVSRWGRKGFIVEADFAQLEMVELAILSGDKQLTKDIEEGVDMHNALFHSMYGRDMVKDERKMFKRCSFALIYGAGAYGIAEQAGISKGEARKFIKTFYDRYPGVQAWHNELIDEAKVKRTYEGLKDPETGLPAGECIMVNENTKRRYWFREYPNSWDKRMGFSPTELKNYQVQGGATGDKVPLILGVMYRVLRNHPTLRDKCLMINTVHDSIMFDVHDDVFNEAVVLIKETLESLPEEYEKAFGVAMPLRLKVGMSYGYNWLDQIEISITGKTWRVIK